MRKYIRSIMRAEGERRKTKPSRWLKAAFEFHQTKKYGQQRRKINQAKGTHRSELWGSRVAMFVEN